MKHMKVIDLFGVDYKRMDEKIDEILVDLQNQGKKIVDFKVIGSALNKCAVFVMYED